MDADWDAMRAAWDAMKERGIAMLSEWDGPQAFTYKGETFMFEPIVNRADGRYHIHCWRSGSVWRRIVEQGESKPL